MVTLDDVLGSGLLQKPSGDAPEALQRQITNYKPLQTFQLEKTRPYQQQYADIYFLRLTKIRPAVEEAASAAWEGTVLGGEKVKRVERVLDVRQGELCWVAGTVYMDMPLKPSILEDVSKDRWISAPTSVGHYYSGNGDDSIMLEDDSGRIRLVGNALQNHFMVTGCIVAVMGTENANGEFEVIDLLFAELPPQPERWSLSKGKKEEASSEDIEMMDASFSGHPSKPPSKKIAIVSGLEFSNADTSYAMELNLLLEYLLGEALDPSTQRDELSHITRLIIAGNSISTTAADHTHTKTPFDTTTVTNKFQPPANQHKKYGYDSSSYNPIPSQLFDNFLSELLPTMPVTLLPGALDPANASYPQQPIHPAMFPQSRTYMSPPKVGVGKDRDVPEEEEPGWFDNVTNPWEGEIEGWRVLGTGGQNLDDVFKYVESEDRLGMMEAMCRWRCVAPTAPDTLWAYPFQEDEPFVIKECPHLFFVGCQPEFGTKVIHGSDGQAVRLIAVPSFSETREVVLVDTETLDVERVRIVAE